MSDAILTGHHHTHTALIWRGVAALRRTPREVAQVDPRQLSEAAVLHWLEQTGYPAPRLLAEESPSLIITRLEGPTLAALHQPVAHLAPSPGLVRGIAALLAELHALPQAFVAPHPPREALAAWCAELERGAVRWRDQAPDLFDQLRFPTPLFPIEPVVCDRTPVLCHGDLHLGNLIAAQPDGVLTVLDWELARVADPAFDLARALHLLGWPLAASALLLTAYLGCAADSPQALRHWADAVDCYRRVEVRRSAVNDLVRAVEVTRATPLAERAPRARAYRQCAAALRAAYALWGITDPPAWNEIAVLLLPFRQAA